MITRCHTVTIKGTSLWGEDEIKFHNEFETQSSHLNKMFKNFKEQDKKRQNKKQGQKLTQNNYDDFTRQGGAAMPSLFEGFHESWKTTTINN